MMKKLRKPKPIKNWLDVLRYAWSIKFSVLCGICSAGEIILTYYPGTLAPGTLAGFAGSFSFFGVIARVISQKELEDEA